jgi:hypothetical protein
MFRTTPAGEPVAQKFNMVATRNGIGVLLLLSMVALLPAPASAVTLDQVVALTKAGVSEAVILAVIDRDKTILTIEPDQLIALKKDGVSEAVILAMLKSGRAEGEAAANANAALNAEMVTSALSPGPDVVIVGHGPDRPNSGHQDGFYSGPPVYALPYSTFLPYSPYPQGSRRPDVAVVPSSCVAPLSPAPSVTPWRLGPECAQPIQPRHPQPRRRR